MRMRFVAALLVTVCSVSLAEAQGPDAIVERATGNALVKDEKGNGLSRLRKGDKLIAGQWISCASGCKELVISYCNINIPVASTPRWKRIRSINCGSLEGERGGASKGEGVSIIAPKESELVVPGTFLVRWKPHKTPIKLALRINLGEKIWGPIQVDGNKHSFTSDSLKAALRKAQKAGDLHLALLLDDGSEQVQRVKFDLISAADQQKMKRELKMFEGEPDPILKSLGRGMVFSEYGLYAKAVSELNKALVASQNGKADKKNSFELRNLIIMANYKAYNDKRVKQLCESSRSSASGLPDVCSKVYP
jgi:hypothetical protein